MASFHHYYSLAVRLLNLLYLTMFFVSKIHYGTKICFSFAVGFGRRSPSGGTGPRIYFYHSFLEQQWHYPEQAQKEQVLPLNSIITTHVTPSYYCFH